MLVTIGTGPPTPAVIVAGDTAGQVTLVPGGPAALSAIVALKQPQPAWSVIGGAGAGIVQTAGNTQVNNVRLSGDLVATGAADRYSVSGVVTHANDRGVETARNWSTTGKYDRFLTTRLFANANTNFTSDRFRDIDLRTALGAGHRLPDSADDAHNAHRGRRASRGSTRISGQSRMTATPRRMNPQGFKFS
jgi:hypothetical protein